MLKKIFILATVLLCGAYLVVAMTRFNKQSDDATCRDIVFHLNKDALPEGFITEAELKSLLKKGNLDPQGKKMNEIKCRDIENYLKKSPFIENAECYKSPTNCICIEVVQRVPILRIMASNGEQYYLDTQGDIIPLSGYTAHLPIVTGSVTKKNASQLLNELSLCIQKDNFWNNQIEQIHVTPAGELEMIPRVGDHVIFLGKPKDMEGKLNRLRAFYQKALNKVGWNKYSRISLEFNNQIICTKKREVSI